MEVALAYYVLQLRSGVFSWLVCCFVAGALVITWLSVLHQPPPDQITSMGEDSLPPSASSPSVLPPRNPPEDSVHRLLRSNQLLRYLDDYIFDEFSSILEQISLGKGMIVRKLDEWGFCVVGSGEVEVRLVHRSSGDNNEPTSTVFQRARAGDSLLPMCTILDLLLVGEYEDASSRTTSRSPTFPSSKPLQGYFEIIASQDVHLYVAQSPKVKDWMIRHRQSSTHVVEEILRRYFCTTAPICIAYFGLESQWSTLMTKLSITSQITRQNHTLRLAPARSWLNEIVKDIRAREKQVKASRIVLDGHIYPSHSQQARKLDGQTNIKSKEAESLLKSKKASALRSSRSAINLQIKTSSFGPTHGEDPIDFAPPKAEVRPRTNGALLQNITISEDDMRNSVNLRREIATQVIRNLVGESDFHPGIAQIWNNDDIDVVAMQCAEYISVEHFEKGTILVQEGARYPGIIFIIDGAVSIRSSRKSTHPAMTHVKDASIGPAGILGTECLLPGIKSVFEIVASTEALVGILSATKIHELAIQYPQLIYYFGKRLVANIPELLSLADFAIGWKQYHAGHVLPAYAKSNTFSVVLHGKFCISIPTKFRRIYTKDVPAGNTLGMAEMISGKQQPRDIICLRKSEIASIQASAFEALAFFEPRIGLTVARMVASSAVAAKGELLREHLQAGNQVASPKTIAILALSTRAPLELFTAQLMKAIVDTRIKSATSIAVLSSDRITDDLGGGIFHNAGNVRLESYIDRVEESMELTLLVADISPQSTWNRACVAHADSIILVAMADDDPKISELDKTLIDIGTKGQIHLALIHEQPEKLLPGATSAWLKPRNWINGGRHHFRIEEIITQRSNPTSKTIPVLINSFHRLARRLFRRSIALVLGGGGARGTAHVGFIKAMEERGIPVDIIGGSSMGACVGGVLARDLTAASTYHSIKTISRNLQIHNFIPDITFPYIAKTTGHFFQKQLQDLFGDHTFDDTWLEYYCAVTNVTKDGIAQTLNRGSLSTSIAASMSYLGAVPPTCIDGDLLVDSCYSSNLPARYAGELGAETIFVIDVSRLAPLPPYNYGSTISGWNILTSQLRDLLPWGLCDPGRIPPSSSAISERLTIGTSTRESEALKDTKGCYYIKLALPGFTTKDFGKFEELVQQGYDAGKAWFDEREALGDLPNLAVPFKSGTGSKPGKE